MSDTARPALFDDPPLIDISIMSNISGLDALRSSSADERVIQQRGRRQSLQDISVASEDVDFDLSFSSATTTNSTSSPSNLTKTPPKQRFHPDADEPLCKRGARRNSKSFLRTPVKRRLLSHYRARDRSNPISKSLRPKSKSTRLVKAIMTLQQTNKNNHNQHNTNLSQ